MTIWNRAPSVQGFVKGWSSAFDVAVAQAAGRDGRLSLAEAKRLGARTDGTQIFADDAIDFLTSKGQKSVSVAKLEAALRADAQSAATLAAGKDSRLSLSDAKGLPTTLRDDFFALRGVGSVTIDPRTPEQLRADVTDAALAALDNGIAKKLSAPPNSVKGTHPLVGQIDHPATKTRVDAYVAGGHLYLSRASDQPSPLVGWYDAGKVPAPGTSRAALRSAITQAADGLDYMTESDAKVLFVRGDGAGSAPITADTVRANLANAHDLLTQDIYFAQNGRKVPTLADRDVEARDAKAFLAQRATVYDPNDPASVAMANKWKSLGEVLESQLTDLHLFAFGSPEVSMFLVGRTADGDLAGVLTAGVET